jgi:translation initiation factor IF-2
VILSGLEYGRVRAMLNEAGQNTSEAGPSIPVEVLGLSGTPKAGDEVIAVADERKAREIALFRQGKGCAKSRLEAGDQPGRHLQAVRGWGQVNILNVVLKADVQGSAEAIVDALTRLSTTEVQVKIIASGVGGINESDVNLAKTCQGHHDRFQCARRQRRQETGRRRRAEAALLQHHLRTDRRRQAGDGRYAQARVQGGDHRFG